MRQSIKRGIRRLRPYGSCEREGMREIVPFSVTVAAGGLLYREHAARTRAERLTAATMETLRKAIDANEEQTGKHVRRVASYPWIPVEAAALADQTLGSVDRAPLFPDIGSR